MKKTLIWMAIIAGLLLAWMVECNSSSDKNSDEYMTSSSDWKEHDEFALSEKQEALKAAQGFISLIFAPDAKFHTKGVIIEETEVKSRYKILQEFESKSNYDDNLVYRIWVQKFGDEWEYGNVGVEIRHVGTCLYSGNGNMKARESSVMTKIETGREGNIEYSIVKKSKPNYVIIYTPTKLKKDDLKKLYNHFKNDYESIRFTINKNPDENDYFCIQYGLVFDYDKDEVLKLANW